MLNVLLEILINSHQYNILIICLLIPTKQKNQKSNSTNICTVNVDKCILHIF